MSDIKSEQKNLNKRFSIFMRQLHLLALVQHNASAENMNYRAMADLLSLISGDEEINDKNMATFAEMLREMGFPVNFTGDEPRPVLEKELSVDQILEILPYYLNLISDTMGIRDCFKSYVQNHGSRSLWIIGRIYFASLQKKRIEMTYRSLEGGEKEKLILNPYRWIYRDNAVYLIARNIKADISLYKLNRIGDVLIRDEIFNDIIPEAGELLRYSMGASVGDNYYNVILRFMPEMKERIEDDFGHLDPLFIETPGSGYLEAGFTVCDLGRVCQAVFGYCGRVKIVAPKEAVDEMKRMLDWNMQNY